jgi:hypothetical protein
MEVNSKYITEYVIAATRKQRDRHRMSSRPCITRPFHCDAASMFCRCAAHSEEAALAAFQRLFRAEFSFKE